MSADFDPKNTILIAPIGFTRIYKRVHYLFPDSGESVEDWLSCTSLLAHLFGERVKEVAVILMYPKNEGAEQSMNVGWPEIDRESVLERFNQPVFQIAVSDEPTITETDLWDALEVLHEKILDLKEKEGRTSVIFDLTHSYRHLSFAGFIEALFLKELIKDINIKAIYYALAKQPLNEGDFVRYVKFDSFVSLIELIGWVKDAIHELRPKVLENLAARVRPQCPSFSDWLQKLAQNLFTLRMGLTTYQTFDQLEELLADENVSQAEGCGYDHVLLHQELTNELRAFLNKFYKDEDTLLSFYERQHILAYELFNRQEDIMRTYAYLREMLVSCFVECCVGVHALKNESGDRQQRKEADQILKDLADEARKSKTSFLHRYANFTVNDIGQKRNLYAHVMMGLADKRQVTKTYEERKAETEADLQKTKDIMNELIKSKRKEELRQLYQDTKDKLAQPLKDLKQGKKISW
ncbi:MAG: TM1812 family CRISPR-associated protein [Candidatus Hermodarchaeota archaeon]